MEKENMHRKFHRWNIILFLFTAILLEICTFIYNGLGFLPKYFLIDFSGILFFAVILMLIPNGIANICVASFILFIQVVLSFANANLLLITGEVFAWDMLSVLNEAARAAGKGIGFSITFIFIAVPILLTYVLLAIKLYRYWTKGEPKPTRNFSLFKKNFLLTTIVALVCAILFTGQKAYIEKISANEDTMLNDKYLYDTFYSHQEGYKKFGTFGYYLVSGIREINNNLLSHNSYKQDLRNELDIYFEKNSNKENHNEFTGISQGNNLIYILWETGDFSGINKDLTPNLYELFSNSLVLNEYYGKDQTNISEGKFLFGSYPSDGFLNYNYLENVYPFTLPNMFRKAYGEDTQVVSYHNNEGSYYKRDSSHEHFGFDEHVDALDMDIEQNDKEHGTPGGLWINLDSEMFRLCVTEQDPQSYPLMVPVDTDKPFFSYVATFSTHGPFEDRLNPERVTENYYQNYLALQQKLDAYLETNPNPVNYLGYPLLVDENTSEKIVEIIEKSQEDSIEVFNSHAKEYLLAAMDFDQGLGYLLEALRAENRLEDTTIVVLSDHYAYYHDYAFNSKGLERESNLTNPESYHIPGFIYDEKLVSKIKSMDEITLQQYNIGYTMYEYAGDQILSSNKFFNNTDMVPTLLNLFGIEYDSAVYLGEDLFNESISFVNSRKGGIFNNQFYTNDGYNILNLDEDYIAYKEGKKEFTEEEIAAFEQYEEEIKKFIKEVSDFIVKTNYLNMIYDSNYFAYRLLA